MTLVKVSRRMLKMNIFAHVVFIIFENTPKSSKYDLQKNIAPLTAKIVSIKRVHSPLQTLQYRTN